MKQTDNLEYIFSNPKIFFELLKDKPEELKKIIESKPTDFLDLHSEAFDREITKLCQKNPRLLLIYNQLMENVYEAERHLNSFLRKDTIINKKSYRHKRRKLNDGTAQDVFVQQESQERVDFIEKIQIQDGITINVTKDSQPESFSDYFKIRSLQALARESQNHDNTSISHSHVETMRKRDAKAQEKNKSREL